MAGARVTSLEALVDFRAALVTFRERGLSAVGSLGSNRGGGSCGSDGRGERIPPLLISMVR
jgi:hypothetical protein